MSNSHETPAPRRKWMTVRWTRVSTLLAFFIVVPMLAMWFLEPWYVARAISRDDASLSVAPVRLPDVSLSPLAPARVQRFESSFQVPWDNVETRKDSRSVTVIRIANGPGIIVFDPKGMTELSNGLRSDANKLRAIFGERALSSGYDWMAAELAATPAQIHWWNRANNVRLAILLGLKQSEVLQSSVIYRVENQQVRGFQIGRPGPGPMRVDLELFDVNNRRYEIVIGSQSGGAAVTQADLNAIIASFRPIPHS